MTPKIVRWALPALVFATGVVQAACVVPGPTHMGFTVGVASAPPPTAVVVEPTVVQVETGAYVVTDPSVQYDMFQFGATWYLYSGGYWYQAPSYRGPFAAVDVRYVPRAVLTVPPGHWKNHPHGGPPGLERKRGGREG